MTPEPHSTLPATPALQRLLERLGRRLASKVWMHGIGTLLTACSLWLAFAFFADWALHVPAGVRWLFLFVALALPAIVIWRELVRYLRRLPDRAGLALLVERAHPDLRELLVSAVQLQDREPDGDPALISKVLDDADRRARELRLTGVLEDRAPRQRVALGGLLASAIVAAALFEPLYASIFVQRLVGRDVGWPQLTWLTVSVPNLSDRARIRLSEDEIEVRVARGTDVPVLVRADGRVPAEVVLNFDQGHEAVLGTSGGGIFRTLLRSCQEDLSFHVTGGDDRDGLPRVRIVVLEPPDVSGLAVHIRPPAYSGLPERTEYDHDVEVLSGSHLSIAVLTDPPEVDGSVRLLPEDRVVELTPTTFRTPRDGAAAGEALAGLGFELDVDTSLRYRFELQDAAGLSNPDPGLFAVHAVLDRSPEVEIVSPGRLEIDTVPGGTVAVRARADDDFGVVAMAWTALPVAAADAAPLLQPLEFQTLQARAGANEASSGATSSTGAASSIGVSVSAGARIDVEQLAFAGQVDPDTGLPLLEGEQFLLDVRAVDNRPRGDEPGALSGDTPADVDWALDRDRAGVGVSSQVRVRVVSEEEYLRRLQDRLSRLRMQVTELEELQRQKRQRTRELLASLESDDPELGSSGTELSSALTGQRRVQGDAEAVTRELASIVESLLYARIDEKSGPLLEDLDRVLALSTTRSFEPQLWRGLVSSWMAQSAGSGLAGQLTRIVDLSLTISTDDVQAGTEALDAASRAVDLAGIHANLLEADRGQEVARAHMEELLGLLAEWDNFQSILSLTRDILNRQKSLRDRTREYARDK